MNRKTIAAIMAIMLAALLLGCSSANYPKDEVTKFPAPPTTPPLNDFPLGVGDSISIKVYRFDDLSLAAKVDSTGKIIYPMLGDLTVNGKTIYEVRDMLTAGLSKYIKNPQVSVSLTGVESQRYIVLGEVQNPGVFMLDKNIRIFEALIAAGGTTDDAKIENIAIIRGNTEGKTEIDVVNIKKFFAGDLQENVQIMPNYIVYVPQKQITKVSWFFQHLQSILGPIVTMESGIALWPQVEDVLQGGSGNTSLSVSP